MSEETGWVVCISVWTREAAEGIRSEIGKAFPYATHLRPLYRGDDGLDVPGPRVWVEPTGDPDV